MDHEHQQAAAAAKKRKQRQRKLPNDHLEEQLNDTVARAIARADPEVRRAEQQYDTAARATARADPEVRQAEQQRDTAARATARQLTQARNDKKFFPLSLSVDEITRQYKFDQPCGLWNKPCVHGCGYIHFSAATHGTLARCCAGGLLSSISVLVPTSNLLFRL